MEEKRMTETVRDPVSRVRMGFQREGENLIIDFATVNAANHYNWLRFRA
jgi:hypothetical protein